MTDGRLDSLELAMAALEQDSQTIASLQNSLANLEANLLTSADLVPLENAVADLENSGALPLDALTPILAQIANL